MGENLEKQLLRWMTNCVPAPKKWAVHDFWQFHTVSELFYDILLASQTKSSENLQKSSHNLGLYTIVWYIYSSLLFILCAL